MSIQTNPFLIPFAPNVCIAVGLGYYAYNRLQTDSGNKTLIGFFWINVFSGIWTLSRALQYLLTSETLTLALFGGIYVGWGGVTVAFFYFALAFTDKQEWLTGRAIAAISVVPAIALVAAVTNPYHSLLWTGEFQFYGDLYIYQREFAPLFLVYLVYTQGFLYYAVYRLIRFAVSSRDIYRPQAVAIIVASLFPMVLGVLYGLGATPVVPDFVDLTPVGFATAGLFYGYAIFRHQLLDIVPVARDTVVESMRDGYVVLDTDDRIVDLNDAAARVASEDDAISKRAETVFPQCAGVIDAHDHGTQAEAEFSIEVEGARRFLIASVSSLRSDNRLIGRLLLIRDVTERRAVQKRYQALIENSSDLIFVMEPDGTMTYASPSLRNVTGADPELVQGENAFHFIHEDDRERVRDAFDAVQAEPGKQQRIEYRILNDDGEWLNVEAELSNLLENPFVEGIVSNARDITARKERERELQAVNEQLVEANERLDQFASVVSHDLRNPINVADGHLQLARETGNEEHFEKIDDAMERMETIIDDVLTLARQGKSVGETESVSLDAIAHEAWGLVETGEARLSVVDDVCFEADPDRLRQLFENVFRNAVEHGSTSPRSSSTPEDAAEHAGPSVTVRVGWDQGAFYVADDGPGVPVDRRESMFDAGETTTDEGTGLGLAIVREIVTAHGWEVGVTESAEGGARFEFRGVRQLEAAD